METPNKLTRPEMKARVEKYFATQCHQGPNKHWIHACGNPIHLRDTCLSIHNTPTDRECGGQGKAELHLIPFCPECEPDQNPYGCLHDLTEKPIPLLTGPGIAAPILVWRFEEAPEEYKKLSPHGGDEEWLALVPPIYQKSRFPDWMDGGSRYAVRNVSKHLLHSGFLIVIACNA